MNIYILLGHPDSRSLNGALADAYEAAARATGHAVRRQNLGEMMFDPVLHHGYETVQALEPDLLTAQTNINWCNHWVIFYPIWWGSVPGLLKGFVDRTLYSGFAYRYHETDPMWDGLLAGRTGHIFTTSDAPNMWTLLAYRNSDLGTLKSATMGFCGIKPIKVTRFDRIKNSTPEDRRQMIERVSAIGRRKRA